MAWSDEAAGSAREARRRLGVAARPAPARLGRGRRQGGGSYTAGAMGAARARLPFAGPTQPGPRRRSREVRDRDGSDERDKVGTPDVGQGAGGGGWNAGLGDAVICSAPCGPGNRPGHHIQAEAEPRASLPARRGSRPLGTAGVSAQVHGRVVLVSVRCSGSGPPLGAALGCGRWVRRPRTRRLRRHLAAAAGDGDGDSDGDGPARRFTGRTPPGRGKLPPATDTQSSPKGLWEKVRGT